MDFIRHITIPKNTQFENPQIETIKLPPGVIREVGYFFPLGCKGLAHLTIWVGSVQQWPRSQGLSYYGDNVFRQFPENFILPNASNRLIFKCWNLDDTWSHTVTIHITVLGEDEPNWIKQLLWSLAGGRQV